MTFLPSFLLLAAATLTSTADINNIISDGMQQRRWFEISGTVAHKNSRSFVLDDGNGRIALFSNTLQMPQTGDVVRVGGWTRDNGDRWSAIAISDLKVLGRAALPARKDVSLPEVAAGHCHLQDIRILGCTIEDAYRDEIDERWNILVLRESASTVFAFVPEKDGDFQRLKRLIGARVSPSGICNNCLSGTRRHIGVSILLADISALSVVAPPPDDPFDIPCIDNFYAATPQEISKLGRRNAIGSVIARWHGDRFLMITRTGEFSRIDLEEDEICPPIGATVQVAGKPETDLYRINLARARVKVIANPGKHPTPAPDERTVDLCTTRDITPLLFGKTARLRGIVRTQPENGSSNRFYVDMDGQIITVEASGLDQPSVLPAIGSLIDVSGVCFFDYSAWHESVPLATSNGFSLILRSASDLRILRRPSPLTTARLLFTLCISLVLLVCFIWWNRLLNIKAERRGHELAAERLAHAKARVKVEERTRLAVELHDALSQTITGVAFQVDSALAANNGTSADCANVLKTARQMLASCRKELQCCLWDLRCRTFEEKDMTEAVTKAIEPHVHHIHTQVRFNVPRTLLSESTAHTILKIVRELVVNAIRHGKATEIKIAGEFHDGVVTFSVRDNGSGFVPSDIPGPRQGHFGLHGIRERLAEHNGTLTVESTPGNGSRFSATLSVVQDETSCSRNIHETD